MAEETIDAGLLEQTKTQIRKLVAEIAELAESDIQPTEFHAEFLNRVVAAVAATGGALWLVDPRSGLRLHYQLEFNQTGLLQHRQQSQPHDALLGCMMQATSPMIFPPGSTVEGVPGAGNPTAFSLILAPLVVDKQVVGLVEILMDPTRRAASQKSTVRFVSDLCDLAAQYLKNRQVRQMMSQQRLWNQLEGFAYAIHSSLDLRESAYAVANDGKRLVGCDRLSVALKIGGRMMIEAVSGQEIVEQRANLIRELTRLCKVVSQSGEDLVYTGNTEGFPPDIRDALEMYVDESGSKALVVTLLHKPESDQDKDKEKVAFGCLVAEQIGDEMAPTDMQARTEVITKHASTALWNAQDHDKIFLLPVLKALGSPWRFFRGRTLAKIVAVLLGIVALICILAFVPWRLTVEGKGSLLPENRQITYAPVQGIVSEVPFEEGEAVKKGDVVALLTSKQ
ncbi:MAG: secretion protein HlyD, partial [Isosphaeraceae bacterium]